MNVPVKAEGQTMSFRYGDEEIVFQRITRPRISDRISIHVHPDTRIVVAAPEDTDNNAVLNAVKKRSRWIYEQLRDFRSQLEHVTPRRYVSGETHYYLGKQYMLKVIEAPGPLQGVKLLRGKLEVTLRTRSGDRVRGLLVEWYKARAKETFAKRLDAVLEQTLWVAKKPPLRILTMQTQWGSCSPHGRITLNPHLVKAPRECIDYVVLHELCHLAEHNHSERFYRLMSQVMPEWEATKERLDRMAATLIQA